VLRQAHTKRARSYEAFGSLNPQVSLGGVVLKRSPDLPWFRPDVPIHGPLAWPMGWFEIRRS
jgi:hypothetical protein